MEERILKVKREGEFHYPIYFEKDFENLAAAVREENLEGRTICIVTDTNVSPLYAEEVKRVLSKAAGRVFVLLFSGRGSKQKSGHGTEALRGR